MATPPQSHSFTLKSNGGKLRVLQTHCWVCAAYDPMHPPVPVPPFNQFVAIWDTGATGSVITKQVANACGLVPTGMVKTHGVQGEHISPTYLVNIRLPNGVGFAPVQVTEGILPGGAGGDVLIGMDIITAGDFSITNKDDRTIFSFRYPSLLATDYVAEHNAALAAPPVHHHHHGAKKVKQGKKFGKNKKK